MEEIGATANLYLQQFDQKSETEIAREAGVSRQRIHQLERKFQVCGLSVDLRRKREAICPNCGGKKGYKAHLCQACYFEKCKAKKIRLGCYWCGKQFEMALKDAMHRKKVGYKHFFCGRRCLGKFIAKNYGFGGKK